MRSPGSTPSIWPRLEALDGKGFAGAGLQVLSGSRFSWIPIDLNRCHSSRLIWRSSKQSLGSPVFSDASASRPVGFVIQSGHESKEVMWRNYYRATSYGSRNVRSSARCALSSGIPSAGPGKT